MLASTDLILKHFGLDTTNRGIIIHFGGPLCAVSGVGASAASCVALARALNEKLQRNMSEDDINAAAFEGEKGYHGTPSGIDNTAATFGGLLKFQRSAIPNEKPIFETRKLIKPIRIVYASTGITSSTTKVVAEVASKKAADAAWYDALEHQYESVYERAEAAFGSGDWKQVGLLCNENHVLLQKLGVSCKELDDLVIAARNAGALGAKLAGTGQGGLMFAVCEDEKSQEQVLATLSKLAPQAWTTSFQ
jgi:mevalonate kinase